MTDERTDDNELGESRYMTGFFATGAHQDVLAIWDDNGHGADVWYDADTGTIGNIIDWADNQGLLANGAEMAQVIAEAKKAIEKCLTFDREPDQGGP
jgi:hypothetical protein